VRQRGKDRVHFMLEREAGVLRRVGERRLAIAQQVERDEAEREPPCDAYPWDGVRNVRPFSKLQASVTEGVY